ncbi:MAG: N-acetylneuraminate synthase family protein [Rhodospirillaceae bacterium]|nr:N-acetylneuraminate synthase family protein [Rhodospirillaceae bacterium]
MNETFDFQDVFVFDLANNHQGNVEHALAIIKGIGTVVRKHGVRGVFKFQFRQLDTFVHPAHQKQSDNKHIPRFLSTRLERKDFQTLLNAVRAEGMLAMSTPFDEESVEVITDMGFDLIKVASCSAKDWPLLEKIADANLPVIFSTGGLQLGNIDDLVSFFDHRGCEFAVMHCVSLYPIPNDKFHLDQIDILKRRYRNRVIGWSTHEDPAATIPVTIAVAKGAQMFERHVGIATKDIALNAYSSTPEQVDTWIAAAKTAKVLCGSHERQINTAEIASLDSLRRGVFAKKPIKKGQPLTRDQVYFAMPYQDGQVDSGHWRSGIVAEADVKTDAPLMRSGVKIPRDPNYKVIKDAIHEVKALLNEARITLGCEFDVEYSHHYGVLKFREFGAVIINCINREYCKKILVQLPGQVHPAHYHKLKEETFQVLFGELRITVDGRERTLLAGDTCLVLPGVWHSFRTETGCVIEEVSTTHFNNDSVYKDKAINALERHQRKTKVNHWGRWQLAAQETES